MSMCVCMPACILVPAYMLTCKECANRHAHLHAYMQHAETHACTSIYIYIYMYVYIEFGRPGYTCIISELTMYLCDILA